MESEDTQTMEGEALVADCEIMKENLTEFTGTEKQLDDSQIFAFLGGKSTNESSPSSFPRTPLAPKNNRITGPSRPSNKLLTTRGPAQVGFKQTQHARTQSFLRSPTQNTQKPPSKAIPARLKSTARPMHQPSDESNSHQSTGIPSTHSPLHSNDPPCSPEPMHQNTSELPSRPFEPAEHVDHSTCSKQMNSPEGENDDPLDRSNSNSPSPDGGSPRHA